MTDWTQRALAAHGAPAYSGRPAVAFDVGLSDTWDETLVDWRGRGGAWQRHDRVSAMWTGPGEVPAAFDPYRRKWVAAERAAQTRDEAADLVTGLVLAFDLLEDERRELAQRDAQWRAEHQHGGMPVLGRAERYLSTLDPSIAGAGGASALMRAAKALVVGFGLDHDTALALLVAWDAATSKPAWGRRECARAIRSAQRRGGDVGYLLRDRRAA
ncbi:MAG: hypothetical protein JNL79_29290 [Myxococcales bacterium]|nr:hypothetical protein [Myxococcales bacterium]